MGASALRYCWGPAWEEYYHQFWTEAEIIDRIRRIDQEGRPISLAAVAGEGEWRLIRAAAHYFGSWQAAVVRAGYNYDDVREDIKWTKADIVKAVRALHQNGGPLHSRAVQEDHPALFAAAIRDRLFGSWEAAIRASGLAYEDIRKYKRWDDAALRQGINALKADGIRLNAKNVRMRNSPLYYAACTRYGSWGSALRALGHDYARIAIRRRRSRAEIIGELKHLASEGVNMSDSNVRRVDPALYASACKTFGSWTKARSRAGIRYDRRAVSRGRREAPVADAAVNA